MTKKVVPEATDSGTVSPNFKPSTTKGDHFEPFNHVFKPAYLPKALPGSFEAIYIVPLGKALRQPAVGKIRKERMGSRSRGTCRTDPFGRVDSPATGVQLNHG